MNSHQTGCWIVSVWLVAFFCRAETQYLVSSHQPSVISRVDADGKVLKQIANVKHPQDAAVLEDGRIFSSEISGAKMFSPDGRVLWTYAVPEDCQNPVAQVLGEDRFLVGNEGPCRLREINSKGETLKLIQLSSENKARHGQFRFCRKTPQGTYLVPLTNEGLVKEFDPDGNVVRDFGKFNTPVSAIRMKNGNTLIGYRGMLAQFSPQGEKVWEFDLNAAAGGWAPPVTGLVELDNGNILFGVYHADAAQPDLYEVSTDQKIVRTVTIPSLSKIAAVQVLQRGSDRAK